MLAPAHGGHWAMMRAIIRQAAAEGSFDHGLAGDAPDAQEFFARLKRALASGYFVEPDARTGRAEAVAVPGYVFWPEGHESGIMPVGFGLFRALEGGYELWMAALDISWRGKGHGHALLDSLFATPSGRKSWTVRVPHNARYAATVHHLLPSYGFDPAGDTEQLRWFVRRDTPPALAAKIRNIVSSQARSTQPSRRA